ncbi:hypothetical protein G7009_02890 [Pseudomonas capeferrum]|uniref:hypothetical protein n=1 Tax=Pseudomonas capeferrum TaxID=1495066 RepID=UPI0015E465B0|nr:hypothetical protein [Pseudomonas capeferrum]MBA1200736.1 hypothetical protein [Pseudomonas capeferrum]
MKEWEVIFADQKGEPTSLLIPSEERPSEEYAAQLIRKQLFPLLETLDLNDFKDRDASPTARWLKEQNGVVITGIHESP